MRTTILAAFDFPLLLAPSGALIATTTLSFSPIMDKRGQCWVVRVQERERKVQHNPTNQRSPSVVPSPCKEIRKLYPSWMIMSLHCLLFLLARPIKILVFVLPRPIKFFRRASHAGISMGRSSTVLDALLETIKSMLSTRARFHLDANWRRMTTNYPKESYMVI